MEHNTGPMYEIMSVKDVAEFLKISDSKIRRMVKRQQIPYAKVGGQYRFYLPIIRQWLEQLTQQASITTSQQGADIAARIWDTNVGD